MGSNNKRRRYDQVTIRPQGSKEGAGHAGGKRQLKCPLSFKLILKSEYVDRVGASLHLRGEHENLVVYLREKKIAQLSGKRSEVIKLCIQSGYNYMGAVKRTKRGNVYGEFIRTP